MKTYLDFVNKESIGGILLIIFAILALIASNTSLADWYHHILSMKFSIQLDTFALKKPILLWINDGLMALFFLLVGLELKREIVKGELEKFDKIILPIAGALGGMVVPALLYVFMTRQDAMIAHGWAIPMATDIAFALGILALFGKRISLSLKVFLMTLAIIDDLGAILIIAIFHTQNLSLLAFCLALACLIILLAMNFFKVSKLSWYLLVGLIMWTCVLKSGFHATIAGVLLALTIPMETRDKRPMLESLEHDLHPLVAYLILPIFAFANAGVPISGLSWHSLMHPLISGITISLLFGKIVGISLFTWVAKIIFRVKMSFSFMQLCGVAALCGIGFTMSLFIAGLSFSNTEQLLNYSRIGILLGTCLSMVLGCLILYFFTSSKVDDID